ncbi:hypothetical protein MTO96_033970 [Rhipicephalus appendiculatus]
MIVVPPAQMLITNNLRFSDYGECTIKSVVTGESSSYSNGTVIPLNRSCVAFQCLGWERRLEVMGCEAPMERTMYSADNKYTYPNCCL